MSDRALFIVRVTLVSVIGVVAAALSPYFVNPLPLVGFVVVMGLLYAATSWLPRRNQE
ncbi:MAG TPA: hypothetical protein VG452_01575 [Egibacteraceae bacterium]|nr:hypothetical protein [Egibacteraceae bacterium]